MSVDVVTFGCRLNSYESEVMKREAEAAGLSPTRHPDQHLRGDRRGRAPGAPGDPQGPARKPDARIIVTGCAAQTEPETFAGMEEVDLVLGNDREAGGAEPTDPARIRHRPTSRRCASTTS
jgi:threonylcarbamoyladenosine tRNA methylthiotransferase MtaB